ncbi:bifunctional DNA primase/polymerase [Paracoccus sp. PAMC 22219]|uniref:bifunctional DNA primase/polymerase n=1 Tax=Paracoccus sp. PAMC 22219 TaxID=1569209 RepID=UPI0005A84711|nr:bifunctional DNA primase/polymerase [Paracoccus sp. PAMC 22219]
MFLGKRRSPKVSIRTKTLGVFTDHQRNYATHNIPTFPMQGKKPAVKRFAGVGLKASKQLALKFPDIDALGFMAGERSRITVLDSDSTDEDLLRDMMKRHGQSPIIVRSGSDNLQAWYRFSGEKRLIRPYGASVPVDVLGGGVVVAPPSKGSKGPYEFIRGSLDDLHKLRPAANMIEFPEPKLVQPVAANWGKIAAGGRSEALFRHLMRVARHCDDLEVLLDEAFTYADAVIDRRAGHPFTDAEIIATARSVHQITERGDNRFGGEPHTILRNSIRDQVQELGADAYYLHGVLMRWAGSDEEFLCADGMADHMPDGKWNPKRFSKARRTLIEAGIIKKVSKGYPGHAARFSWA